MPTVTKNLIIINVLVFFGTIVAQRYGLDLTNYLGLHFFLASDFNPAQLITYMFMHGGFSHIFFNMFAVFYVRTDSRTNLGTQTFPLLLYSLRYRCGTYSRRGAVYSVCNGIQPACTSEFNRLRRYPNGRVSEHDDHLGASGAVYAILLAFGMLFPNNRLFIFPLPFPIKAKFFVIGYAAIELWSGLANSAGDNVAHFAHLGGMLFGLILILYWRKKSNNNGTYYS